VPALLVPVAQELRAVEPQAVLVAQAAVLEVVQAAVPEEASV
jgi:hypothetical protein